MKIIFFFRVKNWQYIIWFGHHKEITRRPIFSQLKLEVDVGGRIHGLHRKKRVASKLRTLSRGTLINKHKVMFQTKIYKSKVSSLSLQGKMRAKWLSKAFRSSSITWTHRHARGPKKSTKANERFWTLRGGEAGIGVLAFWLYEHSEWVPLLPIRNSMWTSW